MNDVEKYLFSLPRFAEKGEEAIKYGLERFKRMMSALGDPHLVKPVIHIAGTNGKGSTQAMIKAGLEGAGHACHAYTSPHLVRFHERIVVAGKVFPHR